MKWPMVPLREVAPPEPSRIQFQPDQEVWLLTLDQIESHTGFIINKRVVPAREAGSSTVSFDAGNVLYSKLRPYLNKVVWPQEAGIATTELIPLRPRPGILNCAYLTYYLRSNYFLPFAQQCVAGVKMPRIIMAKFWEHCLPLPPLSEQRRIVEILDQADALRKKRAEADAKAERILPALFYRIFGDPATNPMGWDVIPIRSLVSKVDRRNPSDQPDVPFNYIDISGVDGILRRIVEVKTLLGAEAPSRARQVVEANDVLVSTVRPYLRATALVPSHLDNQICSTGFCILRAREDKGFGYLYVLTRLAWFTERLNERARGASYPAVTDNDVLNLYIPYPKDVNIVFAFDDLVSELVASQEQRLLSNKKIESLFSALLHRAFSGDLTARWREARMKELLAEMEEQARALGNAEGVLC